MPDAVAAEEERFTVFQLLAHGVCETALVGATAEEAVHRARDITLSPGALLGIIVRIIITDVDGMIVFEWQYGEGVVFPPREGMPHESS